MTAVERPAPPPVRTHKADRTWVGKSIRRVEDPKFLRGRGGYIADLVRPRHAARRRAAQPACRTRGSSRSTPARRRPLPGVHAVITGARGRRAHRPAARLRSRPDQAHLALPGRRQGALRRRGRRRRRRRQPLPRRGRARRSSTSSTSRCRRWSIPEARAAADGAATGARGARDATSPTSARSTSATSSGDFAEADVVVTRPAALAPLRRAAAGDRRRDRRLRPGDRAAHRAHQLAELHQLPVHGWPARSRIPVNKLDVHPVPAGGSFGSKLFATKPFGHRRDVLARSSGGR